MNVSEGFGIMVKVRIKPSRLVKCRVQPTNEAVTTHLHKALSVYPKTVFVDTEAFWDYLRLENPSNPLQIRVMGVNRVLRWSISNAICFGPQHALLRMP